MFRTFKHDKILHQCVLFLFHDVKIDYHCTKMYVWN